MGITWMPRATCRIARASSRAIASPSAFSWSAPFSAARRIRSWIASGTTIPGTSFAKNMVCLKDRRGMSPIRTGMTRDSSHSRKRSRAPTSYTGWVWAKLAPASTFARIFERSTSRSEAAGFAAQPIANRVIEPIELPARSAPPFSPFAMRSRPRTSTSETCFPCG